MTTPARLTVLVAVGALVLAGLALLGGAGGPRPSITSPTASLALSPSPSASARLVRAAAPATTRGDWQAMSDGAVGALFGADEPIQLSVEWQGGLQAWVQTTDGRLVLKSETLQAPADEIHLLSVPGADGVGCAVGDVGRYRWSRSADGMFLTLTAIEDACADRRTALSRAWVHSLSAVNDGGAGVYPIDGWLQATLPSMRWALGDADLHTLDPGDPAISFVVIKDPLGYDEPCGAGGRAPVPGATAGGAASVTAYADYLRGRPGFEATVTDTSVDGHDAAHVVLTPTAAFECPSGNYALFHEGVERDVAPGQPHSVWIIDVDGPTYVIWYEGEGVTAADEQAVISSLKFLDALPTP